MAAKIRKGTSYREVLAALFLAAVRNVEPRPAVGFKFHAVLVVNSCHLASINSPESDRWLPIFWNLDYVKAKQLEEERRAGWKLPAVKADWLPKPHKARQELITALNNWDEQAARRRCGCSGSHGRCQRGVRSFVSVFGARLPVDRSQGDLRCECVPHVVDNRLAACRADCAVACVRDIEPPPRAESGQVRSRSRSAVSSQFEGVEVTACRLADGQDGSRDDARPGVDDALRLECGCRRPRDEAHEQRGVRPSDLGRRVPQRRRIADAPAGHHRSARADNDECPALHLRDGSRR